MAGVMKTNEMVNLRDIRLPELNKNRNIDRQKALIFDQPCKYNIIVGADFLTKIGLVVDYRNKQVCWFGDSIPLRQSNLLTNDEFAAMLESHDVDYELDELFDGEDLLECYLSDILDAKYEALDIQECVDKQKHLTESQRLDLNRLLLKYKKLFDGSLGVYPHRRLHIDVEPNAVPVHAKAYPVPISQMEAYKKERDHLVELGVLSVQGASEWGHPSFITPKKDGHVRWLSDLRELNKVIRRRKYPLPIITDILRRRKGYKFFTKLDLSMQYYHFELDDESKDLYTIVTHNRLSMRLACSPDWAQEIMESTLRGIEEIEVYIDDIGCFNDVEVLFISR